MTGGCKNPDAQYQVWEPEGISLMRSATRRTGYIPIQILNERQFKRYNNCCVQLAPKCILTIGRAKIFY